MNKMKKQRGWTGAIGFCPRCGQEHSLSAAPAQKVAQQLMETLESTQRIDFTLPISQANSRCSLDYLWGPARGKMFGILVAQAANGEQVHLQAFSGQYNGLWQVPGWVDPVFDLRAFHQVHDHEEQAIKKLSRTIDSLSPDSEKRHELVQLRKKKSRLLMRKIHQLYQLRNMQGQIAIAIALF